MTDFILSCCSTADLTLEHLNNRGIEWLSFHYSLDGVEYADDLGQSMSHTDFYNKMANGAMTRTSQVNVDEYMTHFKKFLDKGLDVFHLTISSGISGSYNSAMLAKSMLDEEYPDRKLVVIDSLAGSSGYGLLMDSIADMKDEGVKIDDIAAWVEENKLTMNHWFYTTDLTYIVRGGRLSKTSGLIGTALNINPILTLDHKGKLVPKHKVIGKKRVQKRIIEIMAENAINGLGYNDKCYISHSNILEQAQEVAKIIEERFVHLKGKVLINNVGTTIGAHTGPGTFALFFYGNKRVD